MARKLIARCLGPLLQGQRGSILIETVMLLSVFGVLGVAVAGATQASYIANRVTGVQANAENVIRNQVDYAFTQDYVAPGGSYPVPGGALPVGFTAPQ